MGVFEYTSLASSYNVCCNGFTTCEILTAKTVPKPTQIVNFINAWI